MDMRNRIEVFFSPLAATHSRTLADCFGFKKKYGNQIITPNPRNDALFFIYFDAFALGDMSNRLLCTDLLFGPEKDCKDYHKDSCQKSHR